MVNQETKLIRGWRLKLSLLLAIITPTVATTGTFYSLKLDAQDREAKLVERISALEVSSGKTFADKEDLHQMREDLKEVRSEVSEIKTILIRQHR